MIVCHITCYRFRLYLNVSVRVPGDAFSERQGALFAVEDSDGNTGWGEASPLPGFSRETLADVSDASRRFSEEMCGCSVEQVKTRLLDGAVVFPSLYFALDSALGQLDGASAYYAQNNKKIPLCALAGGDAQARQEQAAQAVKAGYRTVKIKVGCAAIADDIAVVKMLRRRFPDALRFRFDANRAWSYEDAKRFCGTVMDADVDYIEEPLADPAALERFSAELGMPCAIDETLQELSACLFTATGDISREREAALRGIVENAQALVWKPSLCMSPERMALQTTAPVVLSGAYESGVGTAAVLACAAAQDTKIAAAGVDTYSRFAEDVLDQRLPIFNGVADMQAVAAALRTLNPEKLTREWHV